MTILQPHSQAEWILARCLATGAAADFSNISDQEPEAKTIRSSFLRELVAVGRERGESSSAPISIRKAIIAGDVDLSCLGSSISPMPALGLRDCTIGGVVRLSSSYWEAIGLDGCRFAGIEARGLRLQRGLSARLAEVDALQPVTLDFQDLCAEGHVDFTRFGRPDDSAGEPKASLLLDSARIKGNLIFAGAHLAAVDEFALRVRGAEIGGNIRLAMSGEHRFEAEGPVSLYGIRVLGWVNAEGARIGTGDKEAALSFSASSIDGAVRLCATDTTPFEAYGPVWLRVTRIGGSFECEGGQFSSSVENALNAEGANVGGSVLLRSLGAQRFNATGTVRFYRAAIHGTLDCGGARIEARDGQDNALDVEGAVIDGAVYLRARDGHSFTAIGTVRFLASAIRGSVECGGAHLHKAGGTSFNGERMSIGGPLFFRSFGGHRATATGTMNLSGAKVGDRINFDGAEFVGSDGVAVNLEYASIAHGVTFRSRIDERFHSKGCLRLHRTQIGGALECDGALLENAGADVMLVEGATVGGAVLLRSSSHSRFESKGEIRLFGSAIGTLECGGAFLSQTNGTCLSVEGTTVHGAVLLRDMYGNGFETEGTLRFQSTRISGSLELRNATLRPGPSGELLNLARASIGETLRVQLNDDCKAGFVRLEGCHATELTDDDGRNWGLQPTSSNGERLGVSLRLNLFTYDRVAAFAPTEPAGLLTRAARTFGGQFRSTAESTLCSRRIAWLARQYPTDRTNQVFSPQPYEQLAKVLRLMGHDDVARRILIEKHVRERQYGDDGLVTWALKSLFHLFFGYGYLPARAFWTFIGWWLIGWIALSAAIDYSDAFVKATTPVEIVRVLSQPNTVPASPGAYFGRDHVDDGEWRYERFPPVQVREVPCSDASPVLYALDTMLPLLDLRQEEKCEMADDARWWRWGKAFYAVVGWIITALAALTWTGIMRRVPD